ncbi:MAG: hypothetical protein Q4F84_11215 [Fibrobacter sp.]|nr:hypothetical protein [Fibrobacter sp.]
MLNNKAIAKFINAKRIELEALDELLPEGIREKKDKLSEKVKGSIMEIVTEVCKQSTTGNSDGNTEEKPHKVNINF